MGRGKKLNMYESGQIDAYKEKGESNRAIAKRLGRSENAILNYLK